MAAGSFRAAGFPRRRAPRLTAVAPTFPAVLTKHMRRTRDDVQVGALGRIGNGPRVECPHRSNKAPRTRFVSSPGKTSSRVCSLFEVQDVCGIADRCSRRRFRRRPTFPNEPSGHRDKLESSVGRIGLETSHGFAETGVSKSHRWSERVGLALSRIIHRIIDPWLASASSGSPRDPRDTRNACGSRCRSSSSTGTYRQDTTPVEPD